MSERYVTPEPDDPCYWVGRLSMALAMTLERPRPVAKETLEQFLRYGNSSPDLKQMIREEMKKK